MTIDQRYALIIFLFGLSAFESSEPKTVLAVISILLMFWGAYIFIYGKKDNKG